MGRPFLGLWFGYRVKVKVNSDLNSGTKSPLLTDDYIWFVAYLFQNIFRRNGNSRWARPPS